MHRLVPSRSRVGLRKGPSALSVQFYKVETMQSHEMTVDEISDINTTLGAKPVEITEILRREEFEICICFTEF